VCLSIDICGFLGNACGFGASNSNCGFSFGIGSSFLEFAGFTSSSLSVQVGFVGGCVSFFGLLLVLVHDLVGSGSAGLGGGGGLIGNSLVLLGGCFATISISCNLFSILARSHCCVEIAIGCCLIKLRLGGGCKSKISLAFGFGYGSISSIGG
jgi:hypothetical protein